MTVEYVGDGNKNGTSFGQEGEKIAFFGATPSVKVTLTTLASSASIAACVTTVNEIIDELTSKGLLGG